VIIPAGAAAWVLWILVGLIVAQRLAELRLANRNERWIRAQGGEEHAPEHYPLFFLLHGGWLLGWVAEAWLRGPELAPAWAAWAALFLGAQVLRYWTIRTLGRRWTTRILTLPDRPPIRTGPFRLLRHPNYLAVAVELLAVPMILGAWVTALVATILNAALLLGVRIPAEERALARTE